MLNLVTFHINEKGQESRCGGTARPEGAMADRLHSSNSSGGAPPHTHTLRSVCAFSSTRRKAMSRSLTLEF